MPTLKSSGVIPYRRVEGNLEILLITSRKNGRWGIPKGWLEPALTPLESALQEALEEAGVEGRAGEHALGVYLRRGRNVVVFPLQVEVQHDHWLEENSRQRRWFPLEEAAQAVEEDALKRMILDLERIMATWGES